MRFLRKPKSCETCELELKPMSCERVKEFVGRDGMRVMDDRLVFHRSQGHVVYTDAYQVQLRGECTRVNG